MADYFFFGLAFLPTNDIEDCFVDLMADAPETLLKLHYALHIRNLYGTLQVVKLNSSLDKQQ
jgi:hypothetical protein